MALDQFFSTYGSELK